MTTPKSFIEDLTLQSFYVLFSSKAIKHGLFTEPRYNYYPIYSGVPAPKAKDMRLIFRPLGFDRWDSETKLYLPIHPDPRKPLYQEYMQNLKERWVAMVVEVLKRLGYELDNDPIPPSYDICFVSPCRRVRVSTNEFATVGKMELFVTYFISS